MKQRITWRDTVPFPGNPIYEGRLLAMRRTWGGYVHSLIGTPVVFDNAGGAFPDLSETALVIGDGMHRRKLALDDNMGHAEFACDLHRGLSRAEVHRVRRGLNDRRTVKPAETFLSLAAEGNLDHRALVSAVEGVGWHISHEREPGGLSCTNELQWIWRQDHGAMVRAIESYEAAWGQRDYRSQARVIKGLGAFWIKYPEADPERLRTTLGKTTPEDLYHAGRLQHHEVPFIKNVYDGIRYVIALGYNANLPARSRLVVAL